MRGSVPRDATNVELRWHIGKEQAPLDQPPYRAYFYWVQDQRLVASAEFDAAELAAEIGRKRKAGEKVEAFEAAQKALSKFNG